MAKVYHAYVPRSSPGTVSLWVDVPKWGKIGCLVCRISDKRYLKVTGYSVCGTDGTVLMSDKQYCLVGDFKEKFCQASVRPYDQVEATDVVGKWVCNKRSGINYQITAAVTYLDDDRQKCTGFELMYRGAKRTALTLTPAALLRDYTHGDEVECGVRYTGKYVPRSIPGPVQKCSL